MPTVKINVSEISEVGESFIKIPVEIEGGGQGEKGDPGPRGEKGEQGEKGDPGGGQGDKGPPGDKGSVGDKGPDGNSGADGQPGEPGEDGKNGLPGSDGDQGETGDKGLVGDKGPDGDQGPRGEKGPPGDSGGSVPSQVAVLPGEIYFDDIDASDDDAKYVKFFNDFHGRLVTLRFNNRGHDFKKKNFDAGVLAMWLRLRFKGAHPKGCGLNFGGVQESTNGICFVNPGSDPDQFIHNCKIQELAINGQGLDGHGIFVDHAFGETAYLVEAVFMGGFSGDNIHVTNMTDQRIERLNYRNKNTGHRSSTPARIIGPECSIFGSNSMMNINASTQTGVTIHAASGDNQDSFVYRINVGGIGSTTQFVGAGKSEHRSPVNVFELYNLSGGYVDIRSHETLIRTAGVTLINISGQVSDLNNVDWGGMAVRVGQGEDLNSMKGVVVNGQEIIKIRDLIGKPRWFFGKF